MRGKSQYKFFGCAIVFLMAFFLWGSAIAAEKDKLKIAIVVETGDLDLLKNISGLNTYTLVFDPLIRYGDGGKLQPALAESWTVSKDGKALNFRLRKNVTFSDGTPFDAEAAVWNLKRWMGKPDFSWIGVSDAMESILVKGSHELTINLKHEVPAALLEMTIVRPVRFLSPKAVDKKGKQIAPIGTGAWVITENTNARTLLERNPNYWGDKPQFKEIELKVVPDELARSNGLRAGDLDVIGGDWVSPLSPRRAKTLQKTSGVKVIAESGTTTILLAYSPKSPMLADKGVREAISLGLDRKAIVKVLYEGFADPTANLFSSVIPNGGAERQVLSRNVKKAKSKLRDAGWVQNGRTWTKDGRTLKLELMVSEEALPGSRRLAEMVQGMLSGVGIKVTVSSVDNATIHDRRPEFKYDLTFMVTYGAPYDPHGTLANLFLSDVDSGPDGKIFSDPALDPIVRAALAASGSARTKKMQAIYNWLNTNHAVAPLVTPQRLWAHNERVKSFVLPATDYDMPNENINLTN